MVLEDLHFINSSSITIQGLTFLTCGTESLQDDFPYVGHFGPANMTPIATIFVVNAKQFQFHQNAIQDNTIGYGLLVYQCDEVKVSSCSFFNFNQSPIPDEV